MLASRGRRQRNQQVMWWTWEQENSKRDKKKKGGSLKSRMDTLKDSDSGEWKRSPWKEPTGLGQPSPRESMELTCSTWEQTAVKGMMDWAGLGQCGESNENVQVKVGKVTESRNLRMRSTVFFKCQRKQETELCKEKLSDVNVLLKSQDNKNSLIWASEKLEIKIHTK